MHDIWNATLSVRVKLYTVLHIKTPIFVTPPLRSAQRSVGVTDMGLNIEQGVDKCPNLKLFKCLTPSSYKPLLLKHLKGQCFKKV